MPPPNSPLTPVLISADQVTGAIDVPATVEVLHRAFAAGLQVSAPPRIHLEMGDGSFLTMPAAGSVGGGSIGGDGGDGGDGGGDGGGGGHHGAVGDGGDGGAVGGVKVVTIRAANPEIGAPTVQAVYLLFGGPSLAPLAVMDGPALTNLRTAAVSALATRHLARPSASTLVIFGAGAQATAHLTALAAVRPIEAVTVVSRTGARAEELVRVASGMGLRARVGQPADVADADIVCCCTTSPEPLFDGARLRPGTHVVAVGAYQPNTRELDEVTITRGRVVVEDRSIALAEAGEFAIPVAAGRYDMTDVAADLIELCAGATVRRSDRDITVFKSVGMAAEDLVVAAAVYRAVSSAASA